MNITVYCGAAEGVDPSFAAAARELGEWIGANGHTLVYGAGSTGLMGAVEQAAVAAGADVVGVIPHFLTAIEPPPDDLTRLELVDDMPTRKTRMIELADAFVALPGGPGTLEEFSEVLSLLKLGRLDKPLIVANIDGFYDPLDQMLAAMLACGFMGEQTYQLVQLVDTIDDAIEALRQS